MISKQFLIAIILKRAPLQSVNSSDGPAMMASTQGATVNPRAASMDAFSQAIRYVDYTGEIPTNS